VWEGLAKESQRTKYGRLKRNRQWRGQRNKNPKLCIGSWNIKTLLKPGKMQELAEELAKTRLEIVVLQEIRWSGKGVIKKEDFSLYYSGTKEQLGQAGTGFILMESIMNIVIGFEAINERMCNIRIKGKYNNVSLVNM
jgi:exonuclease III